MNRWGFLLACWVVTPTFAWDPVSVFNNAVQGQVSRQINRGVSSVFRSIETPSAGDRPADAEIRDARPGEVVLYATPSCGYCKQARTYLQNRGIPYLEKDVSNSAQAESEWRALGGRGVPLAIMGNHKLTGFSAATYDKAYAQFQADKANAASTVSSGAQAAVKQPDPAVNPSVTWAAYRAGDLLSTRIARVTLLADPRPGSRALSQLEKQEEVIYLGEAHDRYLKVKSVAHEGWVDQALVAKP
jgi:glutaredoxin